MERNRKTPETTNRNPPPRANTVGNGEPMGQGNTTNRIVTIPNNGRMLRGNNNGGQQKQLSHTEATGNYETQSPQATKDAAQYPQVPHNQATAERESAEI